MPDPELSPVSQHSAEQRIVVARGRTSCRFGGDGCSRPRLADENLSRVPDRLVDTVLVGAGVFLHGVHVHPALVGERVLPHTPGLASGSCSPNRIRSAAVFGHVLQRAVSQAVVAVL